ncbi:MAG: hypothetical protein LBO81_05760 [Clostridiales Family XIII bacterium]|nr:hypothetical protein [Clostridiales Family XIII bacterium]
MEHLERFEHIARQLDVYAQGPRPRMVDGQVDAHKRRHDAEARHVAVKRGARFGVPVGGSVCVHQIIALLARQPSVLAARQLLRAFAVSLERHHGTRSDRLRSGRRSVSQFHGLVEHLGGALVIALEKGLVTFRQVFFRIRTHAAFNFSQLTHEFGIFDGLLDIPNARRTGVAACFAH